MVKVQSEKLPNAVLVQVTGRAGVTDPPGLHTTFSPVFEKLFGEGHRVFVVDLSGLELQDSAVVGDVLRAAKQLKAENGSMLCVQTSNTIRLWKQFKLDEVIPCYESVEEALKTIA